MTDWDLITSQIVKAMEAVEDAHLAGKALQDEPTPEKLSEFKKQMSDLANDLKEIQYFMEHEDLVFSDDIADVLSEMFTGKPAPYRKSLRG